MAITRAQQVRQMLKEGTKKPAMQGGGPNYLGKQPEVTVPRRWKSSPDHPDTELAYITEPEKKVLIALNMHGGLEDGKPNKGPKGVISLQGDMGSIGGGGGNKSGGGGGGGGGGEDRRESYISNYSSKGIVKGGGKKVGVDKDGSPIFEDSRPSREVIDRQKARYNKQFFDKGQMPPLGSRPTDFRTKLNQKRNQSILNFINRSIGKDLYRSGFIGPDINKRFLGGAIPTTGSFLGELMASYNPDLIENEINLFDEDSIREIASVLSKTKTGITPIQESALENLRKNIKNREELKEQGMTQDRFEELYPGPPKPKDDDGSEDPCLGPNPPAYCFIGKRAETPPEAPTFTPAFRFMNRGGMVEDAPMGTGIMDLEAARQMMFLGGIAKGIKKGLKGVTRAAKKVFKSPFGKAALLAAPFVMGGGAGSFFGKGSFNPFLRKVAGDTAFSGLGEALSKIGLVNKSGGLTAGGIGSLFGITSLLAALQKPKEDENFDLESYYEKEGLSDFIASLGQRNRFLAEGGKAEPVAKKTMPLLDLDGQEMDFRAEGGFVPIGRMEKADDVPARLSKNEFVFTAEAVRNAGDGDVDKGAEVMYNTMKNLEAGGTMSEESQGQDGAREMFQTAQRLEGVM